jgi:hypothetical protein
MVSAMGFRGPSTFAKGERAVALLSGHRPESCRVIGARAVSLNA